METSNAHSDNAGKAFGQYHDTIFYLLKDRRATSGISSITDYDEEYIEHYYQIRRRRRADVIRID